MATENKNERVKELLRKGAKFLYPKVKDKIFLICLVISFCFWLVNKLNNNYTDIITIPIVITGAITDYDEDIIAQEDKIYHVDCLFEGTGFNLIRVSLKRLNVISPENLVIDRLPGNNKLFHVTIESLRAAISSKFQSVHLMEIINKSVILQTEFFAQKKVPLLSRVSINAVGEYMQIGTTSIVPDSVMVHGTKNVIDTVSRVYTENIDVSISRNFVTGTVKIPRNSNFEITPREALYAIAMGRYTEVKHVVKVSVKDGRGNYTIIPSDIEVSFNVTQDIYSRFSADSISFFVEPQNRQLLDKGSSYVGGDKYIVKHSKLPEGVEVRSIMPITVSVYRTKNR